jgi:hypothetical protein
MGTPLAAPSARLVSGQGGHLFGARRAAGARRRGDLSPSWSRIQFDDSADNLSFGGSQPMTASGDCSPIAAPCAGVRNQVTPPLTIGDYRVGSARRDSCCLSVQPKILGRSGFLVTKEFAEDQITRTLAWRMIDKAVARM